MAMYNGYGFDEDASLTGEDAVKIEAGKDERTKRIEAVRNDLEGHINTHSLEEIGGDTPDFILADYLTECLINFGNTVKIRTKWYGGT